MTDDLMLIIDRRETQVRMDGRAMRVQWPDAATEHIPLGVLGLVIVHGSPLIGCEVWRALAERCIPAVLLPGTGRGAAVCIGAALGNTIEPRIAQHRAGNDPTAAVQIARQLAAAKIRAQAELRARLDPNSPAATRLQQQQEQSLEGLLGASSNASVMGLEGAAAAAWYAWLTERIPSQWRFSGRNRRPPRDPVNALLSLGYTLLGSEMLRAVQVRGLDPAMGFLHGVRPGRESLVLDLIEPLRASVDLIVLGLLDYILPTQFSYSAKAGCRLNKHGRGRFFRAWANARGDWPDLHQVLKVAEPKTNDADAGTAPRTTLPQLCLRQVEQLLDWLRPYRADVASDDKTEETSNG
ncbi:MAG: CRISPR-associated endonuclease Cas1 [Thiohalocapsa sp. PB-PSB1]|jgi:CRISPR-associated protein Cas1|nr:MAG: hypothetical protein N838_28415 [Thiohalocapsa sp. PB-PSB1]QQO56056.1 MAG: CRISPR-associated endonuclease Cas1 [Thiohalocapsa sp. PB-PSB1]